MRRRAHNSKRSQLGSFIAENAAVTVGLWLGFLIPFIDLATIGLRYAILLRACHDGAHKASGCTTFSSGSGTLAVMDYAPQLVASECSQTSGIKLDSTNIYIVVTPFKTNVPVPNAVNKALPATTTIDTTQNVYTIQVSIVGELQPLINAWGMTWLPRITGLTSPIIVNINSQEISENPSGLVQ